MYYLNEKQLQESFLRLRTEKAGGKSGIERTSAVLYFLAFDALLKRTGLVTPVDLDPDNVSGKNNRDFFTREYARLALIKRIGSSSCHVLDLGEIKIDGHPPEKRFSSNFLTVSLKKATTSHSEYAYPSRPANPLLVLGPVSTKMVWGIDRHSNWKSNLPVFLQGRKSRTPFTDLACFVLRQRGYEQEPANLQEGLISGLKEIFTDELVEYWGEKIKMERFYITVTDPVFQNTEPKPFDDHSWAYDDEECDQLVKQQERIDYLEGLLKMHHINFQ